jgi:hypothetical protein
MGALSKRAATRMVPSVVSAQFRSDPIAAMPLSNIMSLDVGSQSPFVPGGLIRVTLLMSGKVCLAANQQECTTTMATNTLQDTAGFSILVRYYEVG